MPRPFQFSLAALFWATGIIAVATAIILAVARERYIAKLACLVGLMVLPMVFFTGTMMYVELAKRRSGSRIRSLTWLFVFGVIYGLSLPWMLVWLLSYLLFS